MMTQAPVTALTPDWRDRAMQVALSQISPAGAKAKLSVVIFHRVLEAVDPLFPEDVDVRQFSEICSWLVRWFRVLPLDEAVSRLQQGALPARSLAITFDDGYADNHDLAMPILRAHGLTATFFIATGFLDGGRMWNDTVVEAVRRCRLPCLELADLGLPGIEDCMLDSHSDRRRAIDSLLAATKYLPLDTRQAMVDQIAERADVVLPNDLMMTSVQVKAMSDAGMQIGAHTASHPILARLDDAQALAEMTRSKGILEELLGKPVPLFAYPNGKPGKDFLARDAALAQRAGFSAAVSTAPGAARHGDGQMFRLPRFTPWDRTRWQFGLRLMRNLL
jgi:peptidoglycan/xylan/chitin deacetylase (PgdA/CDA1 family)